MHILKCILTKFPSIRAKYILHTKHANVLRLREYGMSLTILTKYMIMPMNFVTDDGQNYQNVCVCRNFLFIEAYYI